MVSRFIDGALIDEAMTRLKVDIKDEEQQKRAVLRSVGKEVGANLVAFVTITDLTTNRLDTLLLVGAKVKCWLLDARDDRAIMSAKIVAGGASGISSRYTPTQLAPTVRRACMAAVKNAFNWALKPYPIMRKLDRRDKKDADPSSESGEKRDE